MSMLRLHPIIDVLLHDVFAEAIAFLQLAFELFAAARDLVEIVIGEMTPFLLHLAFDLFPISFDSIPIHCSLLSKRAASAAL